MKVIQSNCGLNVITVELDGTSTQKAHALRRRVDVLVVFDMTCGDFAAADPMLRLHMRGIFSEGTPVLVTTPFHKQRDAKQAAVVRAEVERQQPHHLVDQLLSLEESERQNAEPLPEGFAR